MNKLVVAVPCKKVKEVTVKEWLNKLDEEVQEFKDEIFKWYGPDNVLTAGLPAPNGKDRIAEEGADVCTIITSIEERVGIMKEERMKAQLRVNIHNAERGRL